MNWNDLIIEKSHGIVTNENIEEFNLDFWDAINNKHNSDTPSGELCKFTLNMWGMELEGHYIADWIGDDDYPNETEPTEIQLDHLAIIKAEK